MSTFDGIYHLISPPSPLVSNGIIGLARFSRQILPFKGVIGKILRTKQLAAAFLLEMVSGLERGSRNGIAERSALRVNSHDYRNVGAKYVTSEPK